jgi:hypothetical protein
VGGVPEQQKNGRSNRSLPVFDNKQSHQTRRVQAIPHVPEETIGGRRKAVPLSHAQQQPIERSYLLFVLANSESQTAPLGPFYSLPDASGLKGTKNNVQARTKIKNVRDEGFRGCGRSKITIVTRGKSKLETLGCGESLADELKVFTESGDRVSVSRLLSSRSFLFDSLG